MTPEEKRAKRAAYMREYGKRNADKINQQRRARRNASTLAREHLWRRRNRKKVLSYKKADREKRPDDYARWKRDWESRNAEKVAARKKADYAANKESIAARLTDFRQNNREHVRKQSCIKTHRRRARLASVFIEGIDRDVLYLRDNGRCGICGRKVALADISIDHIIPISKGGVHSYSNVQLAHVVCNKRRSDKRKAQKRLFG